MPIVTNQGIMSVYEEYSKYGERLIYRIQITKLAERVTMPSSVVCIQWFFPVDSSYSRMPRLNKKIVWHSYLCYYLYCLVNFTISFVLKVILKSKVRFLSTCPYGFRVWGWLGCDRLVVHMFQLSCLPIRSINSVSCALQNGTWGDFHHGCSL
jgi:hypothetical protein